MTETLSIDSHRSALDRIRYHVPGYKPIEARIASAILEDPHAFTRMSIVEFSQRIAVSAGSVVRFAQLHGFSGFRELKLAVARDAPTTASLPAMDETPFTARIDAQVRALLLARSSSGAAVSRAAGHIAGARHVDIAASGASWAIASALQFSFTALGLHARALPDPGEQAAAAAHLGSDDVIVVISCSGRTRASVDAARRAREAGAFVVSLTCGSRSPLATHTDLAIALDERAPAPSDEWPLRAAMYAIASALVLEIADALPAPEVRRRRSKWSSGRSAIRYDDP